MMKRSISIQLVIKRQAFPISPVLSESRRSNPQATTISRNKCVEELALNSELKDCALCYPICVQEETMKKIVWREAFARPRTEVTFTWNFINRPDFDRSWPYTYTVSFRPAERSCLFWEEINSKLDGNLGLNARVWHFQPLTKVRLEPTTFVPHASSFNHCANNPQAFRSIKLGIDDFQ